MRLTSKHVVGGASAVAVLLLAAGIYRVIEERRRRPNILLIISDDQRYDDMRFMPRTQARIFDQGIAFERAYVTTPQCCPSRATILSGLYAHNHGVQNNEIELYEPTFVELLHGEGYYTGVIGKYLNSYPDDFEDPPRPEFDLWVTYISAVTSQYNNPELNINGEWQVVEGYQTYILRDFALEFFEAAQTEGRPFLLIWAPYVPHTPAVPAPGHDSLYDDLGLDKPPNFNEDDVSDKANWLQEFPQLDGETRRDMKKLRVRRAQTMESLDLAVESMLDDLEARGMLDDTLVIYLSDNGRLAGEHRLEGGKIFAYEPTSRVPFAIRYPPLIKEPRVESHLIANLDIAPTIYDLVGIDDAVPVDGQSLVPIMAGTVDADAWRDGIILEAWETKRGPAYTAYHTGRYVYIDYEGDVEEFYDLEEDPYQLDSRIDAPEYASLIEEVKLLLAEEW